MGDKTTTLMVAVTGGGVCLKLKGRATIAESLDFKAVVYPLLDQGYRRFALDLTECPAMDSTFLGVLAAFARRLQERTERSERIELLNANSRVQDFLDNLGVLQFFELTRSENGAAGGFEPVAASQPDKAELARTALEAHRTLMDLWPGNIPKFKDVAHFLEEDLKRLAAASGKGGA